MNVVLAFAAGEFAPSPLRASPKWPLGGTLLFLLPLGCRRRASSFFPGKLSSIAVAEQVGQKLILCKENMIVTTVHVQSVVYNIGVRKLPMWCTNVLAISHVAGSIQTRSRFPYVVYPTPVSHVPGSEASGVY